MKLRKILAVTAVAATMTAAFAVSAMADEDLKLYEGTDFSYDAKTGVITLTTNKQHTTDDPYTMLVVVNDEKPLETTGEIPSDTSFVDTDIKQIDQADAKFEKITVGTLDPGTYEIRLGGDGNVRWGTLEVKGESENPYYNDGTRLIGDANNSKDITVGDATQILICAVDISQCADKDTLQAMDANDSGDITVGDATQTLMLSVSSEELKTISSKSTFVDPSILN